MREQTIERKLKSALVGQGHNLTTWAAAHGYNPSTVRKVVARWAGRADRVPQGDTTLQILRDLSTDTGVAMIPALEKAA